jgi:threonine aldolase
MDRIDLRSDTVTVPTSDMREAMATASVGDDVYGEDPTVNELERQAALRLGKEAGIFLSSGTQGNLIAILAQTGRFDEIIAADKCHITTYEVGNPAALGGVHTRHIPVGKDGLMPLEQLEAAIRPANIHYPATRLICLENTQGSLGGVVLPIEYVNAVGALAHRYNVQVHIDGARIFNAATALNCDVAEIVRAADSITFCLSKGLCAPVGSVLVGNADLIARARRIRKALGGGMRQAGILAAAGLIALNEMTLRLHEDHQNARTLAIGLSKLPQLEIDLAQVQTNMVFIKVKESAGITASQLAERLKQHKIWIGTTYPDTFRAVTHYWIKPDHIPVILNAFHTELEAVS